MLSGNMLDTGAMLDQLQSNIAFRATSARDMIMGMAGESTMTPIQRRREIRERCMMLFGMGSSDDDSDTTESDNSMDVSQSQSLAEPSNPGNITTSATSTNSNSSNSVSHNVPSMSEVDAGTKSRAEDSGFSDSY